MEDNLKFEQGARLGQLIEALEMSQTTLSQKIKIAQSSISSIVSGKRALNKNAINAIKKTLPEVDTNWLLTGDGKMFLEASQEKSDGLQVKEAEVKYESDPLASLRRALVEYDERLKAVEREVADLKRNQSKINNEST